MPISDECTLLKIVRDTLQAKNHDDIQVDASDFDDCAFVVEFKTLTSVQKNLNGL